MQKKIKKIATAKQTMKERFEAVSWMNSFYSRYIVPAPPPKNKGDGVCVIEKTVIQ